MSVADGGHAAVSFKLTGDDAAPARHAGPQGGATEKDKFGTQP